MESGDLAMRLKEKVKGLGISSEAAMDELRDRLAIGAEDAERHRSRVAKGPHVIANWWTKGVISTPWVPAVLRFIDAGPQDAREQLILRLDISAESVDALLIEAVDSESSAILELVTKYFQVKARSWNDGIHSHDVWWWLCMARKAVQ